VVVYNDHGLNFFLDKLPTFAIGAAAEYQTADEGWNIPTVRPFAGDPALSWHVINSVVAAGFDVTMCQEMAVDHAVCNPLILWLTARAALGAGSGGGDVGVREVAATYHVPISNTAAGMMLLEPAG
jgi:protocatechuate 4,5-dioxygenase beta chain